jgi:hypothetical protein
MQLPLGYPENFLREPPSYQVVLDRSGHYRAMGLYVPETGEVTVDTAYTYLEACEKARDLQEVALVMET